MARHVPSRGRSAFTLIELLVVIAIIAILAAILFPVFAQAREKARQTVCISNLKEIGLATMMYAQDYDETLPGGWAWADNNDCGAGTDTMKTTIYWRVALQPYIQKYMGSQAMNAWDTNGASRNTILQCPSRLTDDSMQSITSFGINSDEVLQSNWPATAPDCNTAIVGKKLAAFSAPANLVIYADASSINSASGLAVDPNWDQGTNVCGDRSGNEADDPTSCGPFNFAPEKWRQTGGWATCDWDFGVTGNNGDWRTNAQGTDSRRPVFYHNNKCDVTFVDGHVKSVSAGSLNAKIGTADDIWHNINR